MELPSQIAHEFPTEHGNVDVSLTNNFTEVVMSASLDCTARMMKFAGQIMTLSVEYMGVEPPCPFVVAVIGSMARGEATPYSDLEYMFLITEKTQSTMDYFKRLAITSYFLIGNLRETKLSYMDIEELHGWFDDCAKNGFKIDGLSPGAGNIPTGRDIAETENKFILTPRELLSQYEIVFQNPDPEESKRGDFTAMLTYMRAIYSWGEGAESLLPKVKEGMQCLCETEERKQANADMLRNDIKKFSFKPDSGITAKGLTINVKRQIFRFPSILILDLAILHRIADISAWGTLSVLAERKIISCTTETKLKFILSCACFIRLSAYLHHDSHDDRMSVAMKGNSSQNVVNQRLPIGSKDKPIKQQRWFVPFGLFSIMCRNMVPLKDQLQKSTISEALRFDATNPLSWVEELNVFLYCDRIKDCLNVITQKFGEEVLQDPSKCIKVLGENRELLSDVAQVLWKSSRYASALQIYKVLSESGTLTTGDEVSFALGKVHLSKVDEGIQHLQSITDKTALVYYTLGSTLAGRGRLDEAEHCYLIALNMYYKEASQDQLYDYYGELIQRKEDDDNAYELDFISMTPSERIKEVSHGNTGVIKTLSMLGKNFQLKGMNPESISYSLRALQLAKDFYGEGVATLDMIGISATLCQAYHQEGDYEKSLEYSLLTVQVSRQLNGELHIFTSNALNNSGWCSLALKRYHQAYMSIKQAIHIMKSLKCTNTTEFGHLLDSLGEYYHQTGQLIKAQQLYKDAKDNFLLQKEIPSEIARIDGILSTLDAKLDYVSGLPMKCCYPNM